MASVRFVGACGTVTGSCTLLSWGREQVLVDCGLFQGPEELEQLNFEPFPFRPSELSAVVLTHAHLDHSGRLPRLVREGYRGPIFLTPPSRGLVSLLLEDAAELQEEEARFARKHGYSRHVEPAPLFTVEDVRATRRLLYKAPFDADHEILPGVFLRTTRAGHLLGAASVEISAKGADGKRRTWAFSGDVGRFGVPILKDPEPPPRPPVALVLESTYGNRTHPRGEVRETLGRIIDETFARGGSVLVPSFALGRAQEILYHLSALADEGRLDPRAVFLDSPMAIDATELYQRAESEHDEEMAALVEADGGPLAPGRFQRCRSVGQSKALNDRSTPAVIVAGSGMANGGRILHHFARRLSDPRTSVVFVGYQAAGTRGRALVDGADLVGIHGRQVPVRAQIHRLDMLSAHADRDELVRWGRALPGPPERVFLNHGEDEARKTLAVVLQEELGWPRPALPRAGEVVPW